MLQNSKSTKTLRRQPSLMGSMTALLLAALSFSTTANAQPFAYIPHHDDNSVSVINTASSTVVATIPMIGSNGYPSGGIAVTPSGDFVYLPQFAGGTVSVIDAAINRVVKTVPLGINIYPAGIVVSPDGKRAYVPDFYNKNLSVIDTAGNTVIATVSGIPVAPRGIMITPDGKYLYLANYNSSDYKHISVIATSSNTILRNINVENVINNLAVSPDGAYVYAAGERYVDFISTATNTVTTTVYGGSGPNAGGITDIAVSPDSKKLYVLHNLGELSVIDTTRSNLPLSIIRLGGGQYPNYTAVAAAPDSKSVYVTSFNGDVLVVDTASNTVARTVSTGAAIYQIGNQFIGPAPITIGTNTEELKPFKVAAGTGFVSAGTGLTKQPSAINLTVPRNVVVKQVLLYWAGRGIGDSTLVIQGNMVNGKLIGGKTAFLTLIPSETYRADITGLNLVRTGFNTLTISGANFFSIRGRNGPAANDGAGIVVIYSQPSQLNASIQLRDGNDFASSDLAAPYNTTKPQTFTFQPISRDRTATLSLSVADAVATASDEVTITVAGKGIIPRSVRLVDQLRSNDGGMWDTLTVPVTIPANATFVAVQILSEHDETSTLSTNDSLAWVNAVLSIPSALIVKPFASSTLR